MSRNIDHPDRLETAAWSATLEGLRINGAELPVSPGHLRSDQQHVSVLDTGASDIYLRRQDFYAIVEHLDGITATEMHRLGDKVYVECDKPQLIEFKFHARWFPVDPLDMLVAGSRQVVNGTTM